VKRFMVAAMALVIGMTSASAETPQTQPQPKQQPLKTITKKTGSAALRLLSTLSHEVFKVLAGERVKLPRALGQVLVNTGPR